MDESPRPITSTAMGIPPRPASSASTISRAETFHSFSTSPTHLDNDDDKDPLVWKEDLEEMASRRIDSGFESISGALTSDSEWETKTITPPKSKHRHSRRHDRRTARPGIERAHTTGDFSTQRPATSPKQSSHRHRSKRPRHESSQSYSRQHSGHSSRRSSFAPGVITPPHLSRHSTSTVDPYVAHQRAVSIFQALDRRESNPSVPAVPAIPTVPPLPMHLRSSFSASTLPKQSTSPPLSSRNLSLYHMDHEPEPEPKLSIHHRPTVIDWTDPHKRRQEYEKHDRKRRGVEGVWRRVWRWLPGKREELEFWDEKGDGRSVDGGSVRRYRLELGEESVLGDRVRVSKKWRSVSCF